MLTVIYILYYLWDLVTIYIFTLSFKFLYKKHLMIIGWSKHVVLEK